MILAAVAIVCNKKLPFRLLEQRVMCWNKILWGDFVFAHCLLSSNEIAIIIIFQRHPRPLALWKCFHCCLFCKSKYYLSGAINLFLLLDKCQRLRSFQHGDGQGRSLMRQMVRQMTNEGKNSECGDVMQNVTIRLSGSNKIYRIISSKR